MKPTLYLAALPLALTAPTLHLHPSLTRRDDFSFGIHPVAFGGDECSGSSFDKSTSGTGAFLADCTNLAAGLQGRGQHWELTNNFGVNSWLSLASVGSCHFWIDRSGFEDATTDGKTLVGTEDVADIVQDSVARFQGPTLDKSSLVGPLAIWATFLTSLETVETVETVDPVQGTVQCKFNDRGIVPWRLQVESP